ncbi:MAG: 5-formyltetrahydrofolate cyclo-ligase, partial [Idiomarina sp.]|nr:5-formyltetrahydrofolate cyclo-ligase [Idiomarina sp.]
MTRQDLRRKLQQVRRNLTDEQQQAAAVAVADRLEQHLESLAPQETSVAVYKSFAGELPTAPIIERLWQLGFKTVLPVLHPFAKGHLLFLSYTSETPMTINKYGIE